MDAIGIRHANLVRVGVPTSFAGIARSPTRTGAPVARHIEPGAEEPLQVDDEIESPASQIRGEGEGVLRRVPSPLLNTPRSNASVSVRSG